MICKYCGKELDDNAKLCDGCGAELSEAEEKSALISEAESPTPKKSKKGLFIGLGIVAAVAVIIAIALPYLNNLFMKNTLPPLEYYKKAEETAMNEFTEQLGTVLDSYSKNTISSTEELLAFYDSKRVDGSINLKLNDGMTDLFSQLAGADFSFVKDMGIGFAFAMKDDKVNAIMNLFIEGKELLTADAVMGTEDFVPYVTIPQLSDTAMKLDLQALTGTDIKNEILNESIAENFDSTLVNRKYIPDGATAKGIINRYFGLVLSHVNDVNQINFGEDDVEATVFKISFDSQALEALALDVLEELKNDAELWEIIDGLTAEPATDKASVLFASNYDSYIEDVKEAVAGKTAEYTVFVDPKGKITGRSIAFGEDKFSIMSRDDSSSATVELEYTHLDSKEFSVIATAEKKNPITVNATVTVQGEEQAYITVTDMNEDGTSGKLNISFAGDMTQYIAQGAQAFAEETGTTLDKLGIDPEKLSIGLDFANKVGSDGILENSDFTVALLSDGEAVISVGARLNFAAEDGIELPESSIDVNNEEGLISWVSNADVMGFIASLPPTVSNLLTSLALSGM